MCGGTVSLKDIEVVLMRLFGKNLLIYIKTTPKLGRFKSDSFTLYWAIAFTGKIGIYCRIGSFLPRMTGPAHNLHCIMLENSHQSTHLDIHDVHFLEIAFHVYGFCTSTFTLYIHFANGAS